MKARMWAFYIYDARGERVGVEAWLSRAQAELNQDRWQSLGYKTGRLYKQ